METSDPPEGLQIKPGDLVYHGYNGVRFGYNTGLVISVQYYNNVHYATVLWSDIPFFHSSRDQISEWDTKMLVVCDEH